MRVRFPAVVAALALSPTLSAQIQPVFVERDGVLQRVENGTAFRVDPSIVTLRFADASVQPGPALQAAWLDAGGQGALEIVRSNRLGIVDVAIPAGADPRDVVASLSATGRFEFVSTTTIGEYVGIPNDTSFSVQWNLHNVGQSGGTVDADVDGPEAWDIEDGDPSVFVAVLDSGSDWNHPDLVGSFWSNPGETLNGLDDDGNGYVDDIRGWDFGNNDNDPTGVFDHGTWVAGCVAARGNNGQGIAGLAGGATDGQGCRMINCNVGGFSPIGSVVDDAILYAIDAGARVITMSLSLASDPAIDAALTAAANAGIFIDCAAGNNGSSVAYPATRPEVMAVASTNRFDGKSSFSNPGPEVEVAAPGEDIYMTALGGGYSTNSGTSFAAPHVGALAGLLFSANPSLTAVEVRQILRDTADDVSTPGFDNGTGDGRINAVAALNLAVGGALGKVLPYGAGLAGTAAKVPVASTRGGVPNLGDTDFGVQVGNALGGAQAYLLLGVADASLPFKGGTLLVDVNQAYAVVPTTTSGGGQSLVLLPIANDPVLEGASLYTQWVVQDGGASFGFALSNGLQLVIGS